MKKTIEITLSEYISTADDIGNIECNICDCPCQKEGEIWWESVSTQSLLSICNDCMKKHEVKNET